MKKFLFLSTLLTISLFASCKSGHYEKVSEKDAEKSAVAIETDTNYFKINPKFRWITEVSMSSLPEGGRQLNYLGVIIPIPTMKNHVHVINMDISILVFPKPNMQDYVNDMDMRIVLPKVPSISERMPCWESKIYDIFKSVTNKVIQSEGKAFDDASNRPALCKKILEGTIREFHEKNPGFEKDFYFLNIRIGDRGYENNITKENFRLALVDYLQELRKIRKLQAEAKALEDAKGDEIGSLMIAIGNKEYEIREGNIPEVKWK